MSKKEKLFQIVHANGQTYNVYRESKEALFRWLKTGQAGFVPVRGKEMIRFNENTIKQIIEFED
ncbi:hypothetical protein H3C66_01785 [Patescibacteria group bacterium]|nr:hypothetical protein [Patescibacteria group bacterium]